MKKGLVVLALALVVALAGGSLAYAQQQKPLIGIVQFVEHPALDAAREGFIAGLLEKGFKDGDNITLDIRNAQANADMLSSIADHFIAANPALILAIATPAAQTLAGKTESIPILGTAITDYVAARLAKSNEAPGFNVSGTTDMNPIEQQIALIKTLVPQAKVVGLLYTASEDNSILQARLAKEFIQKAGLQSVEVTVNSSNDVQQAAADIAGRCDALYVPTDNVVASSMPLVHEAALHAKIPIICGEKGQVLGGGTATIGIDYFELGRQTGAMAAEVLAGAKVAEMSIQSQSKFEYTLNKTMLDALGLPIPAELAPFAIEVK